MALAAPIMIYGVFALTSLTPDESELEQIYERQLDAVIFSINQCRQRGDDRSTRKPNR